MSIRDRDEEDDLHITEQDVNPSHKNNRDDSINDHSEEDTKIIANTVNKVTTTSQECIFIILLIVIVLLFFNAEKE